MFLASDEAAFITGSDYVIDGGLLLGPAVPPQTRIALFERSRSTCCWQASTVEEQTKVERGRPTPMRRRAARR